MNLTDAPSGRQLVEKTFVYMTNLSKECRKALTSKFEQEHKGVPFESVEPTMRKDIETWFAERDKNINVKHEKTDKGRPGEILITYGGTSKDAHFKFQIDAQFTRRLFRESAGLSQSTKCKRRQERLHQVDSKKEAAQRSI